MIQLGRAKKKKSKGHKWSPSGSSERALELARKYFESLGFTVPYLSTWASGGAGLTVTRGQEVFYVEVRVGTYSKGWKTKRVNQLNSDLIAIVFIESERVHVDDMKAHLALCASSGERALGLLGTIYGGRKPKARRIK